MMIASKATQAAPDDIFTTYCSHEMSAHRAMPLMCTAAKKDAEFLA